VVTIEEPNWLLAMNVKEWGKHQAEIASERWMTLRE